MDGLECRGQVIVIGATNRPDALDAALRRPGRFDRELHFGLPHRSARREIFDIHTALWPESQRPGPDMLDKLADQTNGYGGADIKLLCTEAALCALRRSLGSDGLRALVDGGHNNGGLAVLNGEVGMPTSAQLCIDSCDFESAMASMTAASKRKPPDRLRIPR